MKKARPSAQRGPIREFLENEVYPRLTAEHIYNHTSHDWKSTGDSSLRGGCPFHDSKSGTSFVVDSNNLLWFCHCCKFGGGPIEYLARLRGQESKVRGGEFVKLARELAELAGLQLPPHQFTPEQIAHFEQVETRRQILDVFQEHCQLNLWGVNGANARQYLTEERRFTEEEIKELGLGYYIDPSKVRQAIAEADLDVAVAGNCGVLSSKWKRHITVPYHDETGSLLTIYGRFAGKQPPEGEPKTQALPGAQTKRSPLYFDRARRNSHRNVVLVEGLFDAAMAQVRGDTRVIATVGSRLSKEQVATLKRCGTQSVTICLDADEAGDNGTVECIKKLKDIGINTFAAPRLPEGTDPDKFIVKNGIDAWRNHVEKAIPGDDHWANVLAQGHLEGGDWDEAKREAFLQQAADEEILLPCASLLSKCLVEEAKNEGGECAIRTALESSSTIRVLAFLLGHDRAVFETTMESLRDFGAQAKRVDALKSSVQQRKRQLKQESKQQELHTPCPSEFVKVKELVESATDKDLVVPPSYEIDSHGVRFLKISDDGAEERITICPTPLLIDARYRDLHEGTERVRLRWLRDHQWRTVTVDRREIADARTIVQLADVGIPVTSSTARQLVDYLAAFEQVNLAVLAPSLISRQLGWQGAHGRLGFLWGETLITEEGIILGSDSAAQVSFQSSDAGEKQSAQAFQSSGTFDGWRKSIEPLLKFPYPIIELLTSLSTPLLSIVNAPNPVVSSWSRTSMGKTTGLRISASVWGNPDERTSSSVIRTLDLTKVYAERLAALCHSLPLCFDETSLVNTRSQVIDNLIYGIAMGQGRGRGSPKGIRQSGNWKTALLTTGERPLTSFREGKGRDLCPSPRTGGSSIRNRLPGRTGSGFEPLCDGALRSRGSEIRPTPAERS